MIDTRKPVVLIVLFSLVAEGCPQLALQLARYWNQEGIGVELLCLSTAPNDLRPEFEALGIPIHSFCLGSGFIRYPRMLWMSYQFCRLRKPTALLSFPLGFHSFLAIGAQLAGVRNVCAHVGNLPPVWTGLAFAKFKTMVQLGRPFTHRLLCCSDYIRSATVKDFSLAKRETRAIFNACDLSRFTPPRRRVIAHLNDPPRLGMVARLEPHKDHPTLIRAFALLLEDGVMSDLWLIGEGSERINLELMITQLNLSSRVRLLGSRRDIPELLSQLDIFVFSARPDEGFGIAIAEAMASGVPIVASDVGACREVLEDGRCGLLVQPANPAALAAGIRDVLSDPEGARQRAESARRRAHAHFSVAKMASAYGQELGLI